MRREDRTTETSRSTPCPTPCRIFLAFLRDMRPAAVIMLKIVGLLAVGLLSCHVALPIEPCVEILSRGKHRRSALEFGITAARWGINRIPFRWIWITLNRRIIWRLAHGIVSVRLGIPDRWIVGCVRRKRLFAHDRKCPRIRLSSQVHREPTCGMSSYEGR